MFDKLWYQSRAAIYEQLSINVLSYITLNKTSEHLDAKQENMQYSIILEEKVHLSKQFESSATTISKLMHQNSAIFNS